jgi:hypothetical protein
MAKNRNKKHRRGNTKEMFRRRNQKLRSLGFTDYGEYIESDLWKRRRAAFYATHARACFVCSSRRFVVLHHVTYHRVGEELDTDLVPLCENCHKVAHRCPETFGRKLIADMHAAFARTGNAEVALRERELTRSSAHRGGKASKVRISYLPREP